jgi:peptidoglycan hydrolase CwlO-like protein
MFPYLTPKARPRRHGIWSSPLLFAAVPLLAFLLFLGLVSPALGDTQSQVLRQQLATKQAAVSQAYAQLQSIERELDELGKQLDAAAARLAELDSQIRAVQDDIQQAEGDLENVSAQLEDRLVDLYKSGNTWSYYYLEALVSEDDLTSLLDRFEMVTRVADQDQKLFVQVETYLNDSRTNQALLKDKKAEQQEELDRLVQVQQQMSAKQAQFAASYEALQGQLAALREQIKQAEALEAAAAASASAHANTVTQAAAAAASKVGPSYPAKPVLAGGNPNAPTSAAEIAAQAAFIERVFLVPRASVLTGEMVMDIWARYGISPAMSLAVLNAESGMGSRKWGGRLVTQANNFGCIKYRESAVWLTWAPPISHGKILVGGAYWMTFPSVSEGLEAWARYIAYGRGKDYYRPLMVAGDWTSFANVYYGADVAGVATYIDRVTAIYNVLKIESSAAGYSW